MIPVLDIAVVGGVPRAMGGGGLEIQVERTSEALERRGHRVRELHSLDPDDAFDVLHGFHAEPLLHGWLPHWTRHRAPLVVSPVLPIGAGRERRLLWLSARSPGPLTTARMRREVLAQADAIVALTAFERDVLRDVFRAPPERISVVGNGVAPTAAVETPPQAWDLPREPFLMVGNVSRRKRQVEVLRAVAGRPMVLAGGLLDEERAGFESLVAASGARWLGPVADASLVRALQARAGALVLLSGAEALSLAVLESLSAGTPVIVSDLPSHRELAAAHPGWVRLVGGAEEVGPAFDELVASPPVGAPVVPDWDDVAARLEAVYIAARARHGRLP